MATGYGYRQQPGYSVQPQNGYATQPLQYQNGRYPMQPQNNPFGGNVYVPQQYNLSPNMSGNSGIYVPPTLDLGPGLAELKRQTAELNRKTELYFAPLKRQVEAAFVELDPAVKLGRDKPSNEIQILPSYATQQRYMPQQVPQQQYMIQQEVAMTPPPASPPTQVYMEQLPVQQPRPASPVPSVSGQQVYYIIDNAGNAGQFLQQSPAQGAAPEFQSNARQYNNLYPSLPAQSQFGYTQPRNCGCRARTLCGHGGV